MMGFFLHREGNTILWCKWGLNEFVLLACERVAEPYLCFDSVDVAPGPIEIYNE